MKKNGFTLIETIGIIIVIALVATITIPIVISTNDRNREEMQEKSDIKEAIVFYLEAHPELKERLKNGETIEVNKNDLVNEGYIHQIIYCNLISVKYASDGTYDITIE